MVGSMTIIVSGEEWAEVVFLPTLGDAIVCVSCRVGVGR
jgi:hypothetical protein